MTTSTIQFTGTRVLLTGPLTTEAHLDAMLDAADRLEQAGAIVLHLLSPEHPANDPDLYGFDGPMSALDIESACVEVSELLVVLPGWEDSADVIGDVFTAESIGVGWVEFERLPLR